MIFYFTGTGNSLYVAKKIGGDLISIAEAVKKENQFYSDDIIGFVFPTYAVGIPRIVQRFVLHNRFHADYSFAVMTCGGVLGSSLMQFEALVSPQGLKLDYTNKIAMVDNYGMKGMEQKIKKHVPQKEDETIEKIRTDIWRRRHSLMHSNVLVQWYTKLMNASSGLCYDNADKKFTVRTGRCVKCGLCKKICPQKALSPNRHTVETQYRHFGITREEILAGNKNDE